MDLTKYAQPLAGVFASVIIALVLQIVGFVSPGWTIQESAFMDIYMGLWYIKICTRTRCEISTLQDFDQKIGFFSKDQQSMEDTLFEYRIETTLGLTTCILATLLVGLCCRTWKSSNVSLILYGLACIALVLSGVLAIASAAKFGHELLQQNSPYSKFPYSVLLTGIGGVLCAVSAIFLAVVFMINELFRDNVDPAVREKKRRLWMVSSGQYTTGSSRPSYKVSEYAPDGSHFWCVVYEDV